MGTIIRISDLNDIYSEGLKEFAETLLKSKADKDETVVYSVGKQIIKVKAKSVLWIFEAISKGLTDWEVNYLSELAKENKDMTYWLDDHQKLVIPARLVLDLFDRLAEE